MSDDNPILKDPYWRSTPPAIRLIAHMTQEETIDWATWEFGLIAYRQGWDFADKFPKAEYWLYETYGSMTLFDRQLTNDELAKLKELATKAGQDA